MDINKSLKYSCGDNEKEQGLSGANIQKPIRMPGRICMGVFKQDFHLVVMTV
jgi:hypothetical protein